MTLKRFHLIFTILGILMISGCATVNTKEDLLKKAQVIKSKISKKNLPTQPVRQTRILNYEKLIYKATYLGIHVGEFIATNHGLTDFNGQKAYKLEATAETNKFFSKIYKVRDRFVSYLDPETFNVLRHEVYRREGKYKKDAIIDFDHKSRKAYYKHLLNGSEETIDIPEQIVDVVTVQYFIRSKNWELGDVFDLNVYVDEKVYQLVGLIKKKVHMRLSKLGKMEAYVMEPYAMLEGKSVRKGKAFGYYKDDEYRTPIKGYVKTPIIGKATILLKEIQYTPQ